ncbi:MarR family transcriptional regulator [Tardiphaga alba]|uniref:MarR family transcriptional regulator n=1 Tax=Tardiphaga alba TaxID=340268 RepID=A0ABX8AE73_9BRAD|nr:MarR family transcriptional regulator [Tardiphaga alba]QUS40605.1 MarR family transcriptional regulator [Tardiphaga alba]
MIVTKRDIDVLPWVNGWGGVTVEQIAKRWGVDFSTAARRVRKLIEAGLLQRHYVNGLSIQPIGVTQEGCTIAGDTLRPLPGIRLATWRHDSMAVDLERRVFAMFGKGTLNPDRRIRENLRVQGIESSHIPDIEFVPVQGRPIAIELELSMKAPARLQAIIDAYGTGKLYAEVCYLVPDVRMGRYVRRFIDRHEDKVRVVLISSPENQDA